jgi:FtsP/CotA-like multicopper oxidase with cupredoxin domain
MLGDWLHRSPQQVFDELRGASGDAAPAASPAMAEMPGMKGMQATAAAGGMAMGGEADLSDVKYPSFLLNGRGPSAPWTLAARPGERIRLRIVNAAGSTYFNVALDGHRLEVTHADGMAVEPVVADHLLMGMAESYDVIVRLEKSGSYTLHAVAQDGSGQALGVLHTPDVSPAPERAMPALAGKPLAYAQLRALAPTTLPDGPVRTYRLPLQGDMKRYVWMIDGQAWPKADPLPIKPGERVQLEMVNQTMMWHPMHLHGHFFRLLNGAGDLCPLKHTVNVAPGESVRIEFGADNPGRWFFHCHNVYHLEAGMAREFVYVT